MWVTSFVAAIPLVSIAAAFVPEQEYLGFEPRERRRPNIVFILTDDQDVHLSSLDYMPYVKQHLIDQGTYFDRHYCTTAVCCPSRVTLMTGKASHNTNITDVNAPYGGYPKFVANGFNEAYLPLWLQQGGYDVYYTGKLFNVHTVDNYNDPYPSGFKSTDFLLDPFTYNYLNSTFQHNKDPPVSHEGEYVTDVLAEKAYSLLDEAAASADEKPFFLMIAPSAPHADIQMHGPEAKFDAPVSAPRHRHLFKDVKVPRTENFNPEQPSGAKWLLDLPAQSQENIDWNDHFHRQRLRALQSVDELVDGVFSRLESLHLLPDTYVFYSSDNGFHIGQHRLQPGKSCGYEEDIHIPLAVRGPGVTRNATSSIVTSHTDLASTFLTLAGIPPQPDSDGRAVPLTPAARAADPHVREHVTVEYWGFAGGEGKYDRTLHEHNTYKAIRIVSDAYNLYYALWCSNEHELYDLQADPGQLRNLLAAPHNASAAAVAGHALSRVVARLDALLYVTKSCRGPTCREPWASLHPGGEVRTLAEALAETHDGFYARQHRVEYGFCANGYLREAEGRMFEDEGLVLGGEGEGEEGLFVRGGLPWHAWT